MLYRILLFFLALPCCLHAQLQPMTAQQSHWVDSLAGSEAATIQQQFALTASQTEALHQAYLQGYAVRRQVFVRWWKTDSFPIMMARAVRLKDSLYLSILGQHQYHDYMDTLYRRRERELRKTSLSPKSTQP